MYDEPVRNAPLTDVGTLLVRVSTAGIFLPVEGADVRISGADEGNRSIHYLLTTDRSGLAEKIPLPTPAVSLSLSPGSVAGFSDYNIEVFKQGYYPVTFLNVPLFPGVTSIQAVELIPLPPYDPERYPPREELEFTEREPLFEGEVE
jgi:hypothetical protein